MSRLDEILSNNHGNSVFGESFDEETAKQQIKDLFLEIIGDDENPAGTHMIGVPSVQRDLFRKELRQKVEEL